MADTIGSCIDKLITASHKLWFNQNALNRFKRYTFEEFCVSLNSDSARRELYEIIQKTFDLNLQRTKLVSEVDQKIVSLIGDALAGKNLDDGANIQRPHKTYPDARVDRNSNLAVSSRHPGELGDSLQVTRLVTDADFEVTPREGTRISKLKPEGVE